MQLLFAALFLIWWLSNMPALKRDMIVRNLTKKGFEPKEGDHLYLYYVRTDGRKTAIRTKVSHGSRGGDVNSGLVSAMARQCGLTTLQFKKFAECTIDQQQYEQILTASGRFSK